MAKAKEIINIDDILKLSFDEQIKKAKAFSKRANVRLKLIEDNKLTNNQAYNQAKKDNEGRKKVRYYEGIKYNDKEEVKKALINVVNFLNNDKSTLTGVKKDIQSRAKATPLESQKYGYNNLSKLSIKELSYVSRDMAKKSNTRLAILDKKGIDYYAYEKAMVYNVKQKGREKNRFYTGTKFKNKNEVIQQILHMKEFLQSKSSTLRGLKSIHHDRVESFRKKGLKIKKKDERHFIDFLKSNILSKALDSGQVLNTFVDALNKGEEVEKINKEFQNFLDGNITIDVVQERLHVAEWQQEGGLMK